MDPRLHKLQKISFEDAHKMYYGTQDEYIDKLKMTLNSNLIIDDKIYDFNKIERNNIIKDISISSNDKNIFEIPTYEDRIVYNFRLFDSNGEPINIKKMDNKFIDLEIGESIADRVQCNRFDGYKSIIKNIYGIDIGINTIPSFLCIFGIFPLVYHAMQLKPCTLDDTIYDTTVPINVNHIKFNAVRSIYMDNCVSDGYNRLLYNHPTIAIIIITKTNPLKNTQLILNRTYTLEMELTETIKQNVELGEDTYLNIYMFPTSINLSGLDSILIEDVDGEILETGSVYIGPGQSMSGMFALKFSK
jgi:hypothetical protein